MIRYSTLPATENEGPRRSGYSAEACHRGLPEQYPVAEHGEMQIGARTVPMLGYGCERSKREFGKIKAPAPIAQQLERGRRRTRQDQISPWGFGPREIAELEEIRTERRKTCFFYRTGFERANSFQKYDPAV